MSTSEHFIKVSKRLLAPWPMLTYVSQTNHLTNFVLLCSSLSEEQLSTLLGIIHVFLYIHYTFLIADVAQLKRHQRWSVSCKCAFTTYTSPLMEFELCNICYWRYIRSYIGMGSGWQIHPDTNTLWFIIVTESTKSDPTNRSGYFHDLQNENELIL